MAALASQGMDLGVASRALTGEEQCGDRHWVNRMEHGVMAGVIDGIGHGPAAAAVAQIALDVLSRHHAEPVLMLLKHCHEALRGTRGAVMSLASFDMRKATLTWGGVGNVEGRLLRLDRRSRAKAMLLTVGTLGHRLAPPHVTEVSLEPGDTLILTTDGVRADYLDALDLERPAQQVADDIVTRHARRADDALVLVARFQGAAP